MAKNLSLKAVENLKTLRTINPQLLSYNVEMTEVTGGTFWKAYTPGQIAGTEGFPLISFGKSDEMHQWYDPIDSTNPRLIKLAKELGKCWIRVSGTWSTKTYYDFDGTTNGVAPEGFDSVLTKDQWTNLLDFVKAVDGNLLISVANCDGIHAANEPWNPEQAKLIFDFSKEYGVPIEAVEFMNEPNLLAYSGAPKDYTFEDFIRDQDIFTKWVHENYPECLVVGPCSVGCGKMGKIDTEKGIMKKLTSSMSTSKLLEGSKEKMDVYSYHYYNGVSGRITTLPFIHWSPAKAASEAYLDAAPYTALANVPYRDEYAPGAEMWVTESGDAGGGGCEWASTYLDVFRTLNELGTFPTITNGVIFHNTLASSDYGWLKHGTFEPRPNYFAVLLWSRLMGTTVYDSEIAIQEGAHVFCHSRKDGKDGCVYLVINNSLTDTTKVELPKEALRYTLCGNGNVRNTSIYLNGTELALGENDELPAMEGVEVSGTIELAPGTCTFLVM
ncbi:MAG: beta-glucuronidase [Agathobacter sp.]|nr:beta-glucuronidase [Agathobacter sp.]